MHFKCLSVCSLLVSALLVLPSAGCSRLKWKVAGPIDQQAPSVGPLRIDVEPVDTKELDKDHPFRWRRAKHAAFMLFDVRITNTSEEDILCLVGHLDFPGVVSPKLDASHFLEGAMGAFQRATDHDLITTDDLELGDLAHEKATILMADGYRYQVLSYLDFRERYCYLMAKEMRRAGGLAFIPYVGGFIAHAKMRSAAEHMPERLMQAQQTVMRPGVVPAGSMVRGYLVFAFPLDPTPGEFTLRLPVQPAHVASVRFNLVRRD